MNVRTKTDAMVDRVLTALEVSDVLAVKALYSTPKRTGVSVSQYFIRGTIRNTM